MKGWAVGIGYFLPIGLLGDSGIRNTILLCSLGLCGVLLLASIGDFIITRASWAMGGYGSREFPHSLASMVGTNISLFVAGGH